MADKRKYHVTDFLCVELAFRARLFHHSPSGPASAIRLIFCLYERRDLIPESFPERLCCDDSLNFIALKDSFVFMSDNLLWAMYGDYAITFPDIHGIESPYLIIVYYMLEIPAYNHIGTMH